MSRKLTEEEQLLADNEAAEKFFKEEVLPNQNKLNPDIFDAWDFVERHDNEDDGTIYYEVQNFLRESNVFFHGVNAKADMDKFLKLMNVNKE